MTNKVLNKGTGAGGANTNHQGKAFEKKYDIYDQILEQLDNVILEAARRDYKKVIRDDKIVGYAFRQGGWLAMLEDVYEIKQNNITSTNFRPDGGYVNLEEGTLTIVENKNQNRAGSVDEKIQTGPFKLHQYKKVAKVMGINKIRYIYVLSEYFRIPKFDDVYSWLEDNGVEYYIEEYPILTK